MGGNPNFPVLLKVQLTDRVPGLALKYGEEKIHALITAMLTEFVNFFNVVRPMTPDQIVACAYDMMISTREDFLSLEDIALFFKRSKEGKYGKVYDRLDQQTIFDMWEQYRQARHEAYLRAKDEQEAQFKALPINDITSASLESEREKMRAAQIDYLRTNQKKNEHSKIPD